MKTIFSRTFHSVVEWFRPSRRIQKEQPISPGQFQKMLAQTLADPDFKLLLLKSMSGTVWPIQGRNPGTAWVFLKNDGSGNPTEAQAVELGSGFVGIGTTTPGQPLAVGAIPGSGADGANVAGFSATADSFNSVVIYRGGVSNPQELAFGVNHSSHYSEIQATQGGVGTNALLLNRQGGNVGIATTGPTAKLGIIGDISFEINLANTSDRGLFWKAGADPAYGYVYREVSSGKLFIGSQGNGTILETINGGKVGIGTTSPDSKLDVRGSINQIVYVRPNGSTDGTQINNAIAALPSNGGIIMVTPGTYGIETTININKNGVKLRGYGGIFEDIPTLASGTGSITNGSPTVTGTSTHFTTQTTVGDQIVLINGAGARQTRTIISIASDASLTVDSNFTVTESGDTIYTIESEVPPLTKLLWTGASGASQVVISLAPSRYDTALQDVEISGLLVDGGQTPNEGTPGSTGAGIGLQLDQVTTSVFRDFHVRHMKTRTAGGGGPSIGINLTTKGPNDTAWNLFENCSVIEASQCVALNGEEPTVAANSTHNTFVSIYLRSYGINSGDAGIFLVDCDNNAFYGSWIQMDGVLGPVAGHGVTIDNPTHARANYFYHIECGQGMRVNNANLPFSGSKNLVFGYDQENGVPDPSTDTGNPVTDFVFWSSSSGTTRGIHDLAADGRVSASGYDGIQASDVPSLDASKITSGTFNSSRIPNLDASKITSGQFNDARMPTDVLRSESGAAQKIAGSFLNVAASSSTTVSTGLSSIDAVVVTAMNNRTYSYSSSGGDLTINNTDSSSDFFQWIALGS